MKESRPRGDEATWKVLPEDEISGEGLVWKGEGSGGRKSTFLLIVCIFVMKDIPWPVLGQGVYSHTTSWVVLLASCLHEAKYFFSQVIIY